MGHLQNDKPPNLNPKMFGEPHPSARVKHANLSVAIHSDHIVVENNNLCNWILSVPVPPS